MTSGVETDSKIPAPLPPRSSAYSWYALGVLTLVFACHAIDRGMPNILAEPIRHEFHLTDKQLGLFLGLAYALTFSVAILPMGYISDRTNRRNFLALIVVIWSVCTALGGLSRSYVQLLLARMGVGASESGGAPVAMPMLSDIFPPHRRSTALGIFYLSNALGFFVPSVLGGFIAAKYGWRAAFLIAGVPGIVLAIILVLTVKEPRRGAMEADADAQPAPAPKLREAFAFLLRTPGLITLILGCALIGMVAITMGAWMSSFYIRIHHLDLKQVGLIMGLVGLISGVGSPLGLGALADRIAARDDRAPLFMVAGAVVISTMAGMTMLFSSAMPLVIGAMIVADLCRVGYTPPCYAVLIKETPIPLRGTTMSIMQLTTNVFGFGLGPLFVGALSDLFGGGSALRYAMATALATLILAALLLLLTARLLYGPGRRVAMAGYGSLGRRE